MNARCKSLEGNKYAQFFANKAFFSCIYPMESKNKAGDALRIFYQEFDVPEKLTFGGSKEQSNPGTEFMKQISTHSISYHISGADLPNQNQAEGVIRELRHKCYRKMIRRCVLRELWDYEIKCVSEITSLTHSSAGKMEGAVPLAEVTGETSYISEYLVFGFYEQIWFKDNAGVSHFLTHSLVGIFSSHWTLNVPLFINPEGHSDLTFNRSESHQH